MNKPTLYLLFFIPSFLQAQAFDSLAVQHQIDSLVSASLGHIYRAEFDKAQEISTFVESRSLEVFGNKSVAYAKARSLKATISQRSGAFPEAKKYYEESLTILEGAQAGRNKEYVSTLNNYASLLMQMGMLDEAEAMSSQALQLREEIQGKDNEQYIQNLSTLGSVNLEMGNFAKSEACLLEALAILKKISGEDNRNAASIQGNLGNLYRVLGNYEKSEAFYQSSIDLWAKLDGKLSPGYARQLGNLSIVFCRVGKFEQAESLLSESLEIKAKTQGKEHPSYILGLQNLWALYASTNQLDKALELGLESTFLAKKVFGSENSKYGNALFNLGLLYFQMHNYKEAEPLFLEAIAIVEKTLGKEHPDYSESLEGLSSFYSQTNQFEKAVPIYGEIAKVNQSFLTKASLYLSDQELQEYLVTFKRSQEVMLSAGYRVIEAVESHEILKDAFAEMCFDNTLFYKGFLLNVSHHLRRLALVDSVAVEKFRMLANYESKLAAQYSTPKGSRKDVSELESQCNELQKDIVRSVAGYGEATRQMKWQEVQQKLKTGEAAIEFVHFGLFGINDSDSVLYCALLLRSGETKPVFIPLFEEKSLDSLLRLHIQRRADYVNDLYAFKTEHAADSKPNAALFELIWQPLEKELAVAGNISTIYFAPTGLLHRLNMGAIPLQFSGNNQTLADRYRLVQLGSTRQLAQEISVAATAATAMLYGGIQYEMDSTAIAQTNGDFNSKNIATRGEPSFSRADSTLRGGTWSYLKWTEKEVVSINEILIAAGFQSQLRQGYKATEEAFKSMGKTFQSGKTASPHILHIATHGYFFPDVDTEAKAGEPAFKNSDHPMIRSGIVLAGGNYAWQNGKSLQPDMEDGILTAYEISQMDLSSTELVVLSACETGLGDIWDNEGVYGLQRAFKIAGAKYLIMSLWQVPDAKTQELMSVFYAKWLEGKMSIPDAFQAAQMEMRGKFEHPYFWAGFILVE